MIGEEEFADDAAEETDPDLPDLNDPVKVKAKAKKAKAKDGLRARFVANLLSTPEGREWMWDLLSFCRIYNTSVVPGDPYGTHVNEGQRNVGLKIIGDIPGDTLLLMQKEAAENGW